MNRKKPDPERIDEDNPEITREELRRARPAAGVLSARKRPTSYWPVAVDARPRNTPRSTRRFALNPLNVTLLCYDSPRQAKDLRRCAEGTDLPQ